VQALAGAFMGLIILIVGLAIFIGVHVFTTRREARAALIERIGLAGYKVMFSLVAIVGFTLIVIGFGRYRDTGWIDLWHPPLWSRHIAIPLVWLAFISVTAAYFPGEIKRRLKHPMLVGVKLWAFAHLIANGDLGAVLLFGSILAWAVYDRITLKYRTDAGAPPIPVRDWRNDAVAVVIGTIIFLAFGYVLHPLWIGVAVLGR
jgi:uncharacterized membrane protein